MRIAVVHAKVGNARSVVRALERASSRPIEIATTDDPAVVRAADALVVPGQGAFGAFTEALEAGGLREAILERVRAGAPYLGICLGMQLLFDTSEEAPGARGLGVLSGHVRRIDPGVDPESGRPRPLPHIGWNRVELTSAPGARLVPAAHHYFAHTYIVAPGDPSVVAATTTYGETFPSAVRAGGVVGVQFHPEKSQRAGLLLLERFLSGA